MLIVKTPLGLEAVVKSKIELLDPGAEVVQSPYGLKGIVIVEKCSDQDRLLRLINDEVPEAEKVIKPEAVVPTNTAQILEVATALSRERIAPHESFAVRTHRRAHRSFTSIELNAKVGALIQQATDARVDLDNPDKIVSIEVVGDRTAISVLNGRTELRKMGPSKSSSWRFFNRVSVVQMPYLGTVEGAKEVGRRIGRFVQTFEVGELVIAPMGSVDARELATFIENVFEGIASRLEVQRRSYGRRPREVRVKVQDLYQLVLERRSEPILVFEPEGEEIYRLPSEVVKRVHGAKRVNILLGSREGIPKGVFRLATAVLDLCPDVTLPTELAAPAALIALYNLLKHEGHDVDSSPGCGADEEGYQRQEHPE
ncbi:MAG: SPOUT family RNA methylase [Thaumarchaeota archaeon]|nr:SPOUT family RNA methylase [Candidatus Calditenuaceae archaeon]MDW8042181.1 SPOUT family RNA methylase [Nitrososphaerota archaeon]